MVLQDVLEVVEKTDRIEICYFDPNMNEMRIISEDAFNRFINANGNLAVKSLRPRNYKIVVQVAYPNT